MVEAVKRSLRESKAARWTSLMIVSFTMLCGYYVADVMSPLKPMIEQKLHWTWDCGRWNFFHNEIPVEVLPAYDLVYDSPVFDELAKERGYDLRERIERERLAAEEAERKRQEVEARRLAERPDWLKARDWAESVRKACDSLHGSGVASDVVQKMCCAAARQIGDVLDDVVAVAEKRMQVANAT